MIPQDFNFTPINTPEKIAKGGSARSFLRFTDAKHGPLIFCEYSTEKEENFLYADIADFLLNSGVNTPKVFLHDNKKHVLIMEDLGKVDLLDFSKNAKANELENAYKKTLEEAAKIHTKASSIFFKNPIKLTDKFDDKLYDWEQNYFYDNLVCDHFKLKIQKPKNEWHTLKQQLQNIPYSLIHRDFQSQNVIIKNDGSIGLIDFQGMRLGSFWYDIASLLFDPYANIRPLLRTKLYNHYCQIRGLDPNANIHNLFAAASERLMQALGAFAFLANKKNKKEYLNHIPQALEFLIETTKQAKLEKTNELALAAQNCLEK